MKIHIGISIEWWSEFNASRVVATRFHDQLEDEGMNHALTSHQSGNTEGELNYTIWEGEFDYPFRGYWKVTKRIS